MFLMILMGVLTVVLLIVCIIGVMKDCFTLANVCGCLAIGFFVLFLVTVGLYEGYTDGLDRADYEDMQRLVSTIDVDSLSMDDVDVLVRAQEMNETIAAAKKRAETGWFYAKACARGEETWQWEPIPLPLRNG
jgi:hypothetical protein